MPVDRQQLQRGLRRLAGSQHGYFSAAQALGIGYSYQAQKYHLDRGNWQRIDRALFRLADWPGSAYDHLVRWTVWAGEHAVISHDSALVVHHLFDANLVQLHLTVPRSTRRHDPAIIWHIATLAPCDIEQRDGFSVTRPARALAEFAASRGAQDVLDGAITKAVAELLTTPHELRSIAATLGPRAEVGVERGLRDAEATS